MGFSWLPSQQVCISSFFRGIAILLSLFLAVSAEQPMDLFDVVKDDAADPRERDRAVVAECVKCAAGDAEQFLDVLRFEPFFRSFVGAGLEHGEDGSEQIFFEGMQIVFGQEFRRGYFAHQVLWLGSVMFHMEAG
jgi:hypothetical protein